MIQNARETPSVARERQDATGKTRHDKGRVFEPNNFYSNLYLLSFVYFVDYLLINFPVQLSVMFFF